MQNPNPNEKTPGDNPGVPHPMGGSDIPPEAVEQMRREGWPSIQQQQIYNWMQIERGMPKETQDIMMELLDALTEYFDDIQTATGKLKLRMEAINHASAPKR